MLKNIRYRGSAKPNVPKMHKSRKLDPRHKEFCHDGGTRSNVPETSNSGKLDLNDEISNAPMPNHVLSKSFSIYLRVNIQNRETQTSFYSFIIRKIFPPFSSFVIRNDITNFLPLLQDIKTHLK